MITYQKFKNKEIIRSSQNNNQEYILLFIAIYII